MKCEKCKQLIPADKFNPCHVLSGEPFSLKQDEEYDFCDTCWNGMKKIIMCKFIDEKGFMQFKNFKSKKEVSDFIKKLKRKPEVVWKMENEVFISLQYSKNLKQLQQQRNKLSRQISSLKKANLQAD